MVVYCLIVVTLLQMLLALVAAQSPSRAPARSMLRGGKSDFASLATPITACLLLRGLSWTTEQGAILLNSRHHFHMKGLTWFGMDTADTRAPHGLWATTLDDVLDFLALNKFNVLRLPVAYTIACDLALRVPSSAISSDSSLHGLNVGKLLDSIFERAAARGILVVLALYNDDATTLFGSQDQGLWYGSKASYQNFQNAWRRLLTRYGDRWNLLGVDLLDRPGRGRATWAENNPSTDWNLAAQDTAAILIQEYPQYHGLWFIQGIEGGEFAAQYATDLRGALTQSLDLFTPASTKRVVYEVLLMGPSVSPSMGYVYTTSFPDQMYAAYDDLFGGVEEATGRAVVVGKWGGSLDDAQQGDAMWQKAVADYFIDRCLDDTIYWALNPNAKDTGGVLSADWRTPNEAKLALLARIQPRPSVLLRNAEPEGGWSFMPGSSANPICNL